MIKVTAKILYRNNYDTDREKSLYKFDLAYKNT